MSMVVYKCLHKSEMRYAAFVFEIIPNFNGGLYYEKNRSDNQAGKI